MRKKSTKSNLSVLQLEEIALLNKKLEKNELLIKSMKEVDDSKSKKIDILNQKLYVTNRQLSGLNKLNKNIEKQLNLVGDEKGSQSTMLTTLNQNLYVANRQLSDLRKLNRTYEQQLSTISNKFNTLSFKLGYILIHSTKSFGALLRLPSDLINLSQDAKKRRTDTKKLALKLENNNYKKKTPTTIKKQDKCYEIKHLLDLAERIPISNGSRYYKKFNLTVAIITDEFMFNYYNNVFDNLVYLTPDNYLETFNTRSFDLLIYVSCWSGMNGDEWRGVKYREKPKLAFAEILKICGESNIARVFQTIEDPSNYDHFLDIAKEFDYIFTTDIEKIEDYKIDCANPNVFWGEFGVNPIINNPVGIGRVVFNAAFFAGSYPARYEDRCNDMATIFQSLIEGDSTLVIANRNSDRTEEIFQFPAVYSEYIIPKLEHSILQRVHKLFKYNLNFNSIKHSPTMCAMRVYELQGQGSLIFSNYAKSINNMFPNIDIINCPTNMSYFFEKLQTLDDYENRIVSVRNVMTSKTVFEQTSKMLESMGIGGVEYHPPKVLILYSGQLEKILPYVVNQTYKNIEVIAVGECEDHYSSSDYVTFFGESNTYQSNYINDLVNGFKYTDSDYITKSAYFYEGGFVDGSQHEYVNIMTSKFRTIFDTKKFKLEYLLALTDGKEIEHGYSIDPFELNCDKPLRVSKSKLSEYVLSVIVPLYNNGEFLVHKCFKSLKRNSNFNSMEIILVDDGSTDEATLKVADSLELRYLNVVTYKFEAGGSGSASRPRNKGIELATAPLISFLDPDNEISPGGYDELLDIYSNNTVDGTHVDFVSGYQIKVCKNQTVTGRHADNTDIVVVDPKDYFLNNGNFPVISTQAAVIETQLLRESSLDFVTGAVGQDTLYGHELLCISKRAIFTSKAYILYYAEREDSVTNLIGLDFFKKSKTLEEAQVQRFKKWGVFEIYKSSKFDYFFKHWYLKKFNHVDRSNADDCKKLLIEILDMYGVDSEVYF